MTGILTSSSFDIYFSMNSRTSPLVKVADSVMDHKHPHQNLPPWSRKKGVALGLILEEGNQL